MRVVWIPVLVAAAFAAAPRASADEAAKPATNLVDALRPTRLGRSFERAHVRPYGWVDASHTGSPSTDGDARTARVFDAEAEGFRLQQAALGLERVPVVDTGFDWGFRLLGLWGTDARLLHSRGLFDDQDGEEQFDLLEAHVVMRTAAAGGFALKVGKWVTPMGFEVVPAPDNLLPSRSFLFGFAIPITHAGVLATLDISGTTTVSYGAVLGWDVWENNNAALTQYVGTTWSSPSERDNLTVQAMVGPEKDENERDVRVVLDATWSRSWSDCVRTALNADFGFEERAAPDGDGAAWYGVAGYVTRDVSDALSATLRVEWFRDEDGTRLGSSATLGEVTVGLDWKPFRRVPNVRVRPEVRWDHSFDGPFFDAGEDRDQLSITLDLVVTF
jgi:hypothetical protein